VIYLTTSVRYHDAADSVVALEGPSEVDAGAPSTEGTPASASPDTTQTAGVAHG